MVRMALNVHFRGVNLRAVILGLFVCQMMQDSAASTARQSASSTSPKEDHYTMSLVEDGSRLITSYCFESGPDVLRPYESDTRVPIFSVELIEKGDSKRVQTLSVQDAQIELPSSTGPGCVHWQSDMTQIRGNRYQQVLSPTIRMVPISDWLWVPADADNAVERPTRVDVHLKAGQAASAPWLRLGSDTDRMTFRMPRRFNGRRGFIILGDFYQQSLPDLLDNGHYLDLAILESANDSSGDMSVIRDWIQHHVANVKLAFGHLPVDRLQVIALPINHLVRRSGEQRGFSSPVPWAEVLRGGGTSIMTVLDSSRSRHDFRHDWTLTHELSHLLHPVMHGSERWLYEGIGTYYQNVLRARSGDLTEQQAWKKLYDGFGRGKRATVEGTTLTERGSGRRSFMRIYWTGVVMALDIDLTLRLRSENRQSLDSVLTLFSACCLEDQVVWSGIDFMNKLDQISDSTLFSDRYRAMVMSTTFPSHDGLFAQLGVGVYDGRIVLNQTEKYRMLRSWIMSRPH